MFDRKMQAVASLRPEIFPLIQKGEGTGLTEAILMQIQT